MMDPTSRLPRHVPLVVATRGDAIESVHYGSIAVVDAAGRLVASVGDAEFPIFTRSTLKPFQALPFVAGGGPARFGFSSAQVALLCASHSGEPRHVAAVADMLARSGCSEGQLQCGCHVPLFYAATHVAVPPDLTLSPLQHNCSGKHAGMLAWCRQHGGTVEDYLDPHHPLQQEIRRRVAQLVGCEEHEMPLGIDGCGAPNYALPLPLPLPLARLAYAYARLAVAHDERDDALASLRTAMITHPEMVAGEGRTDLALMRAAPGDWVAKGGAEGVQALGSRSRGLGIAIKIADGGVRALRVALSAVIARLNLSAAASDGVIARWQEEQILNQADQQTGRLLPVFDLGWPVQVSGDDRPSEGRE